MCIPRRERTTTSRVLTYLGIIAGEEKILVLDDEAMVRGGGQPDADPLAMRFPVPPTAPPPWPYIRRPWPAAAPFTVVIMDLTIPGGMGGAEAIQVLRAIDPGVKALVSSGYANDPVMAEFEMHGFGGVIPKPFTVEKLSLPLHRVLQGVTAGPATRPD